LKFPETNKSTHTLCRVEKGQYYAYKKLQIDVYEATIALMKPRPSIHSSNFVLPISRIIPVLLISASASIFASSQAYAEETKLTEKFRIALGGYTIPSMDSTVSLTETSLGAGASISPQDTLGLDTEQTVLRLDGYYRFNNRHALTYSWYSISSDGNKSIEEEFRWVDENGDTVTIPIGARAQTQLDYDIFKIGYLWSFYHSSKVELGAGAGLHISKISMGLDVSDSTLGPIDTKDVKTTVPLPVLSFGLTYGVTPKFHWYLKSEVFAIAIDDWEGVYTDGTLGLEYRFWEHIGLGAGFSSNALKITEKTGEYKFTFDNRITGLLLYVAGYY
jgi:hypothetical protein